MFIFVGETLLPANDYNKGVAKSVHADLLRLMGSSYSDFSAKAAAGTSSDVFCSVVRMGYGKGGKNPVTDLTTFYQPNRQAKSDAQTGSPDQSSGKRSFEDAFNDPKDWSVGIIPSGS